MVASSESDTEASVFFPRGHRATSLLRCRLACGKFNPMARKPSAVSPPATKAVKPIRPAAYTPELGVIICQRVAEGQTLREIGRDPAMPFKTNVMDWREKYPDFGERYARARQKALDNMAEEILLISDDATNDYMDRQSQTGVTRCLDAEHVNRSRLRVDARKWLLSKLKPHIYGDNLAVQVTGEITISVADRLRQRRAELLAADMEVGVIDLQAETTIDGGQQG